MSARIETLRLPSGAPVVPRIVLAYDSPASEQRALRELSLLRESGDEAAPHLVTWPFDGLSDPESLDAATDEAMDADVLLFSSSALCSGPSAGDTWLASCLSARAGRDTTVVALFGADDVWTISMEKNGAECASASAAAMEKSSLSLAIAAGR